MPNPDAATVEQLATLLMETFENAPQDWSNGGISIWCVVAEAAISFHAQAVAAGEQERDGVRDRLSEREQFIRENAGPLLAERDAKIERQRARLAQLEGVVGQHKLAVAQAVRAERALYEIVVREDGVWLRLTGPSKHALIHLDTDERGPIVRAAINEVAAALRARGPQEGTTDANRA
jgi:hypothetical protein